MTLSPQVFLTVPDHAKAYQTLCDRPSATTRSWAEQLGWTQTKLLTFLRTLRKHGLGEAHRIGKSGSVFIPAKRSELIRTDPKRSEPTYLDNSSGLTATRCGDKSPTVEKPRKWEVVPGADKLIEKLNSVMMRRFEGSYLPIPLDNGPAHRAAKSILGSARIPLDEAIELVRVRAEQYTPDKTGGDLPHSLGHPWFSKLLIAEWRRQQRDKDQLRLTLLSVEEGSADSPTAVVDEPSVDVLQAAMLDLKRRLDAMANQRKRG